ncbi:rhomboid family intramembrane serine protease [Brevundimonas sp. 2R-24]|uniref:Rhomboid family intramembrane serine protease n=1 Tax=Peiella sedimenti TaxID=3061083 RepID=A0ABT8SM58_9CAUL|nr:rhomboid family intramembrane serine protease [Caulobacteraceae bacterium XZ-24]
MAEQDVQTPRPSALHQAANGSLHRPIWRDPRVHRSVFGRRAHVAYALLAVFIVVLILEPFTGGLRGWGLSADALDQGRWEVLGAHMVAHAGLWHLSGNAAVMFALTSPLMARLGRGVLAWARYLALFVGSGLAGAGLFLLMNPTGDIPAVGASGAISGLWAAHARLGQNGRFLPVLSRKVLINARDFALANLVLFFALFLLVTLRGGEGGLAWEAHLGGYLFGLLAMPLIAPQRPPADWEPHRPSSWLP